MQRGKNGAYCCDVLQTFKIDSPDVATGLLNITGTSNYLGEQLFLANRFIILR